MLLVGALLAPAADLSAQVAPADRLADADTRAKGTREDKRAALALYDAILGESADPRLQADAAFGKGDLLIVLGEQADEAARLLARAAYLRREGGNSAGAARALSLQGVALRRLARLDESETVQREALALYVAAGDASGEAATLHNLGALLYSRARYDEAADHYTRSIAARRQLGELAATAGTLNNLATIHAQRGDLDLALAAHREALDIAVGAGNARDQAYATLGLGSQSFALGEWQEAIGYLTDAATRFDGLGDRSGLAFARHTLGVVYLTLGHESDAIVLLEQVLPLRTDDPARLGTTLQALGGAYRMQGDFARAREALERALALKRQASDRDGEAATLRSLATLELAAGRRDAALAHAAESRLLATRIGTDDSRALAMALESRVRNSTLDAREAAELDAALARAEARGARRTVLILRSERARVALAAGDLPRARDLVTAAIGDVEALRSGIAGIDLRATWLANQADLLDLRVDILLRSHRESPQAGFDRQALAAAEQARGRRLLDAFADAMRPPAATSDLRDQERARERRVNVAALKLERARAAGRDTAMLDRELDAQLMALRNFRAEQRARLPWRREPPTFDLAALQDELPADATLLAYWLGEERSAAWVVTARSVTLVDLPPAAIVRAAVSAAQGALADAASPAAVLAALSRLLLHPVEPALHGQRLGIAVDGALEAVAFEALPLRDGRPLVATRDVVRLPVAMWAAGAAPALRPAGRSARIAVIADPVFAPEDRRLGPRARAAGNGPAARGPDIPARLPFSRREAELVAALSPRTQVLIDLDANTRRVAALPVDDLDVLHFATHATQVADRPELSSVVLSMVDADGTPVEGRLRLHEIVGLRLSGQVVVLSACRTVVGPDLRGEGQQGLARAFLQAGAGAAVASLWDVDDRATMTLMRHFYTALMVRSLSPPAALSEAQRAMRNDARWAHPRYWAGFTTLGSLR